MEVFKLAIGIDNCRQLLDKPRYHRTRDGSIELIISQLSIYAIADTTQAGGDVSTLHRRLDYGTSRLAHERPVTADPSGARRLGDKHHLFGVAAYENHIGTEDGFGEWGIDGDLKGGGEPRDG